MLFMFVYLYKYKIILRTLRKSSRGCGGISTASPQRIARQAHDVMHIACFVERIPRTLEENPIFSSQDTRKIRLGVALRDTLTSFLPTEWSPQTFQNVLIQGFRRQCSRVGGCHVEKSSTHSRRKVSVPFMCFCRTSRKDFEDSATRRL